MKVTTLLLLISIWCLKLKITSANYRRVLRGPPQQPRPPPGSLQHAMKKWHMPQHRPMQQRPRPIPLQLPQNFKSKSPIGPPKQAGRHQQTIRTQWPNHIPSIKILTTEKPFMSSPAINLPEYEYHLQTNSIPNNHPNTIKQLDEKGPIHTIPAPNLSLTDKPKVIDDIKPYAQAYTAPVQFTFGEQQAQQSQIAQSQHKKNHQEKTIVHIQKAHQYQVTEATAPQQQHLKLPVYFNPEVNQQHQALKNFNEPHAEFLVSPQEAASTQITPQELYKLLNTYPQHQQQQQQNLEAYVPIRQFQYVNNFPRNSPLPQSIQNYHKYPKKQLPVQPQFQVFDFDEQRNNNQMTRVTADYSVKPAYEDGEALAQTQFVQHFFDTRNEHIATNKVEPELKETLDVYFPSIPSKAAETLHSLQESGKMNTKDKTSEATNSVPISIYVPDSERFDETLEEDGQSKSTSGSSEEESVKQQYQEIMQEGDAEEHFQRHPTFGRRKKIRN